MILWLSAAIAVGMWVNDGIVAGRKNEKSKDAGCETFGYGSVKKCDLSQVQVGLAAMIWWGLPYHVGGIAPHNSLGKAREGCWFEDTIVATPPLTLSVWP